MQAHTALAGQLGVSEALLDAMYHIDQHHSLFTDRELVALRLAEVMTTSARDVSEELWDAVQAYFDYGEIIELTSIIGLFNHFNRFADVLQINLPPAAPPASENKGEKDNANK